MLDRRLFLASAAAVIAAPRPAEAVTRYQEAATYSAGRRGVALLVIERGRIVFEDYPNGGGADRAWGLASGTKSFSGVLAAALVQDGLLALDERCADTLTEWRDEPGKREATVRQLLTLTAGVGTGQIGRPPTYAQAVGEPLSGPPGEAFRYGPQAFQVFGEIVRRKLGAAGRSDDVYAYLQGRVLDPAGATAARWTRQEGQPNLPSGAYLTARDWGRFGQFVLDGGRSGGRPFVDPVALAACFEPTRMNPGYGLTWWLLRPGLIGPGERAGLDEAAAEVARYADVRMAAGAGDQRLYLLPDRDLVIVRQASGVGRALMGQGTGWNDDAFLRLALGLPPAPPNRSDGRLEQGRGRRRRRFRER
jgi:CubicO group peptidase (beta-lactamase class C family)